MSLTQPGLFTPRLPASIGPIGVVLTRDGEVWTWGMVLGDPQTLKSRAAALLNYLHFNTPSPGPPPVFREKPWQLPTD